MCKKILSIIIVLCTASLQNMNMSPHDSKKPTSVSLHEAIAADDMAGVQELVSKGCDLEMAGLSGDTPLLRAISLYRSKMLESRESYALEIALLLLKAGANPNCTTSRFTPLHFAAMLNIKDLAQLLIYKGAYLNARAPRGHTPLHYAATNNAQDVTYILCKEGADVSSKNEMGKTPLEIAIEKNSIQSLEILLTYDDNRSDHLLRMAVDKKSLACITWLLLRGIKISNQDPEIQKQIAQLFSRQVPSLISTMITSRMNNFIEILESNYNHTDTVENQRFSDLKNALNVAYAQGFLEHVALLENHMQKNPQQLGKARGSVLLNSLIYNNIPQSLVLIEKTHASVIACENTFLLNTAAKFNRPCIAHLIPKQNMDDALATAVLSRHGAAVEALLYAGAPTLKAEEFIMHPDRKRESDAYEEFFMMLYKRFTEHTGTIHNPSTSSYLSLLCNDIRRCIVALMVKTLRPPSPASLSLENTELGDQSPYRC